MENVNSLIWSQYAQNHNQPLISVIVPVYMLEDYLTQCLDSITQQQYGEIEVVVVDGGSTDSSPKIIDERRQNDARLTVIYADRIGPGRARNLGAESATGEYIWFVDGDDVVSPDCLTAIASRLKASKPDVLFIDHEESYPSEKIRPGQGHALMTAAPATCFTLAQQPWVTQFNMVSWNKVVRRDFFLSMPVRFLPVWPHEDVPVSCLLLLDASKISVLNHVCYRHTNSRDGSAMSEAGERHFRILDSYEMVLNTLEERAEQHDPAITTDVRLAVFQRAIWHYTTIFDAPRMDRGSFSAGGYITPADRPRFFSVMHAHFLRYVPAAYHYPGGFRGVKYRLIKMNAYGTYSVVDPMNKLRVRASSGAAVGSQWIQRTRRRLHRRVASLGRQSISPN